MDGRAIHHPCCALHLLSLSDLSSACSQHGIESRVLNDLTGRLANGRSMTDFEELLMHRADVPNQTIGINHCHGLVGVGHKVAQNISRKRNRSDKFQQRISVVAALNNEENALLTGRHNHAQRMLQALKRKHLGQGCWR